MRFLFRCCKRFKQRNETFHGTMYLGCAFERDKAGGVLRMSQRAFIEYSKGGMESIQCWGSRHPNRQIFVLWRKREPVCDKPVRAVAESLIWVGRATLSDTANSIRAVVCQARDPIEKHWRRAVHRSSRA